MTTVAFIGQKGGIGKTSTTVHLAAALAEQGKRVLIVDTDPQGHSSVYLGVPRGPGLRHALLHTRQDTDEPDRIKRSVTDFITKDVRPNLDVLASDNSASGAALRIVSEAAREMRLAQRLNEVRDEYDICLLDVSPTVDLLSTMALLAASHAVILATPHMPDTSLVDVARRLRHLYDEAGRGPAVLGVIPSLMDARESLSRDLPERLGQMGGDLTPPVPRAVKIAEANRAGQTIREYLASQGGRSPRLDVARAYDPLITWFTHQLEQLA